MESPTDSLTQFSPYFKILILTWSSSYAQAPQQVSDFELFN
jgi:hypothetical protein